MDIHPIHPPCIRPWPEDETELKDDANFPLWRAIFKPLRFSECLYSDMSLSVDGRTNSTKDAFLKT